MSDFDIAIEKLLDTMETPFKIKGDSNLGKEHKLKLSFFDGAEPMLFGEALEGKYWDDGMIFTDATIQDLSSPLNYSVLTWGKGDANDWGLVKVRSINPKDVRGQVKTIRPTMVEHLQGYCETKKQTIFTRKTVWGLS